MVEFHSRPARFIDLTLATPAENVAADEAFLVAFDEGHDALLRVWELDACAIVLGSSCEVEKDVNRAACERDDIPLLRRCSGGGTVLLGPGCLAFSLFLPINDDYRRQGVSPVARAVLERVIAALKTRGLAVELRGYSDLVVDGKKFSGNAQRWRRHCLLHHGTILYDFDLPLIGQYLRHPPKEPDYRAGREHAAFIGNVPLGRAGVVAALREAWQATEEPPPVPQEQIAQLVAEKYSQTEWNLKR